MSDYSAKCKCLRCGYQWFSKPTIKKVLPKVCPECKNPYWNSPYKSWNTPRKKLKKEGEGK